MIIYYYTYEYTYIYICIFIHKGGVGLDRQLAGKCTCDTGGFNSGGHVNSSSSSKRIDKDDMGIY
jgi:hypothetical protein